MIQIGGVTRKNLLSFAIAALCFGCLNSGIEQGRDLLWKKRIRIVVTDSGLGGLSVMDDIALKVLSSNYYKSAEIIFVNALFDVESGYNSLPSREEKVAMLNRVISGIEKSFSPDAIVVACNTLSVLLEGNDFVKNISTPVVGIIEPGVELIYKKLNESEGSRVIIFGTETTVEEGSHIRALKELNIPGERMIAQACPHLQSYIEQNPTGEETEMLINYYFQEAIEGLSPESGPLLISLNCSHYGYSENLWKSAVESSGYQLEAIINPNSAMSDLLIVSMVREISRITDVTIKVVSKVEIRNVDPVSLFFEGNSPRISEALRNYILIPDLF